MGEQLDLGEVHAALGTGIFDEAAVWVMASEPVAPGLAFRHGLNELSERFGARPAGGVPPRGFRFTRSPSFAFRSNRVSSSGEDLGVSIEVVGQDAPQIASSLQSPVPLSGEDGPSRWRTRRGGNVGVVEECSLLGEPIEGGSPNHCVLIGTGMGPAPVVGDGKEDVGPFAAGIGVQIGMRQGQQSGD